MVENSVVERLKSASKLGIALGGGGARGLAHLGVLKVLDEFGIKPNVVSGTSFGSIVGAFYCAGHSWKDIAEIMDEVKWHKVLDVSLQGGLIKGDAFGRALSKYLPEKFEDLEHPLCVIATNIESGKRVVLSSGDLVRSIRASACFPGLFAPVELNGMHLLDGGILDNVPIGALDSYSVDRTVAVNVNIPPDYPVIEEEESSWWAKLRKKAGLKRASLPFDLLVKSLDIMIEKITSVNMAVSRPDLYIHVPLFGIRIHNFDKYKEIFEMGERATREIIESHKK